MILQLLATWIPALLIALSGVIKLSVNPKILEGMTTLGVGRYVRLLGVMELTDSIRSRLDALDRDTEGRQMRKLAAAPDYILGSAHAVTDDGQIVVGSCSGLGECAGYLGAFGDRVQYQPLG
jgi:hypothetical protein